MSKLEILKKYYRLAIVALLTIVVVFILHALIQETPNKYLTVAFLNVGQGDSVYIESPDHHQLIIDGGPNEAMLSRISKLMPWYDRYIDAILISNSDADHYGGFIELLKRYKVGLVIESGVAGASPSYKMLEDLIAQKNIKRVVAQRGQSIEIGAGPAGPAHFDVLFPDRDASKLQTNFGSIIGQLVYGSSTVVFTGDAPNGTEDFVALLDKERIKSDILKIAHHGSKTSASETFISVVSPKYAVISAGLNNKYGHPNQETLDVLQKLRIEPLITFKLGTILFKTDGRSWNFHSI